MQGKDIWFAPAIYINDVRKQVKRASNKVCYLHVSAFNMHSAFILILIFYVACIDMLSTDGTRSERVGKRMRGFEGPSF